MLALFLLNLARAQEEENAVGHGLPLSQGLQRFFYAGIESPELEKKAQGKFFMRQEARFLELWGCAG